MRTQILTPVAVVISAILLGSCGGSSASESARSMAMGSTRSSGGGGAAVSIKDFAYSPAKLTVAKGTTIVFGNEDSTDHTATASNGAFDTGSIGKGQTKTVTLRAAGTFSYVCSFHPFMHGTITVR